ncbi:hypothetical protein [Streptomyces sp. NPDC090445]|uniref:hypothetical protein n=1 Tax=Streptomyces sp. NPDC090445 TaxID=3365963 RepID=UPI00380A7159
MSAAVELCDAVADLHSTGWVHADLQPSHGLHTPHGVHLIDLAWAWRPGFDPADNFKGGIVHVLAPGTAADVTSGMRRIWVTPEAEAYSLAGTLWTCITGRWPLDYDAAGIKSDAGLDERRAQIAKRSLPFDTARPWPELRQVLLDVLRAEPDDRPTAAELGVALAAV